MKKVKKYYYNTHTHKFERLETTWQQKAVRVLGFISAALVTAAIIVAIAFRFLDSPKEKQLRTDLRVLEEKYASLQKQIDDVNRSVAVLENRDNRIYRSIFESAPLPDSIREGKQYTIDPKQYRYTATDELITTVQQGIERLRNRINTQNQSFDTLERLIAKKEDMLSAIPAIQPVSNKNLDMVASGFGYRIDPIYKTVKMHAGLDFAAAMGTPIYATGDGTIATTAYDDGGYGNHVVINHGYGYQTLYGHMIKIKVKRGQRIQRGQVIGWVGSTGKSTGPHCHYEVIKKGEKIDPVHFFFNDLSAADYERLVRMAAANNQSFD
ncbi:MAG: M23 family peptidase [Sphingobacteriales bacterium]|nr:MAG: M23 family peptidase [Sphingobacteriales bacterium]